MPALVNRYELGDILYSDADVVAYRGVDRLLNRAVTVEMLQAQRAADPAYVQRLVDKARDAALAGLPNVAALYDQQTLDGRPFLVMEEPAGPALSEVSPLQPEQAIELVCTLASTVQAALNRGQMVPVLNEHTVRVGTEGRFQILDLGLQHGTPSNEEITARLGHLLNKAVTGTAEGSERTPLQGIAQQALNGSCSTPEALVAQLQAIRHRADQPTTVIGRAPATVVIPDGSRQPKGRAAAAPVPANSPAVVVDDSQAAPRRKLPMWPILAVGSLILLLVLGGSLLRGGTGGNLPDTSAGASIGASTAAGDPVTSAPAGERYVVAARGSSTIRVRNGPGINAPQVGSLPNGTVVEVIGEPQPADGYNWVQIRADGLSGWSILEALRKQ